MGEHATNNSENEQDRRYDAKLLIVLIALLALAGSRDPVSSP